jgi:hypothetical protein
MKDDVKRNFVKKAATWRQRALLRKKVTSLEIVKSILHENWMRIRIGFSAKKN